jgi:hypothetical protein
MARVLTEAHKAAMTAGRKARAEAKRNPPADAPIRIFTGPIGAIKWLCANQCNEFPRDVPTCPILDCPLWPYRFGLGVGNAASQGKIVDPNSAEAKKLKQDYMNSTTTLKKGRKIKDATD